MPRPEPGGSCNETEYVIPRTMIRAPVLLRRARVVRMLDIDVCVMHYGRDTFMATVAVDRVWRTLIYHICGL